MSEHDNLPMAGDANNVHDPDQSAAHPETPTPSPGVVTHTVASGWYDDPSVPGQLRYWTGDAWSASVVPRPQLSTAPPTDLWASSSDHVASSTSGDRVVVRERRVRVTRPQRLLFVVALVVGLLVGFVLTFSLTSSHTSKTPPSPSASSTIPRSSTSTPVATGDPSAATLSSLVIRQSDVATAVTVQVIPGGDQVTGEITLDLCNGTFASEALRTARVQVAAIDGQGNGVLSTEAVLYKNAAATTQAFNELRNTATSCPTTPVVSPVTEPTVTTRFNPRPDANWPVVDTVERLAYDFVSTSPTGQASHSVAVYLRRGRALMGIYFQSPVGVQPAVSGQTTIAGIVNVMAQRLAQLPNSAVS